MCPVLSIYVALYVPMCDYFLKSLFFPPKPHYSAFLPSFWCIYCLPQLLFFNPDCNGLFAWLSFFLSFFFFWGLWNCSSLIEFQVRQNRGKLHLAVLQETPHEIKIDNTIPWEAELLSTHTKDRMSSSRSLLLQGTGRSRLAKMIIISSMLFLWPFSSYISS